MGYIIFLFTYLLTYLFTLSLYNLIESKLLTRGEVCYRGLSCLQLLIFAVLYDTIQ